MRAILLVISVLALPGCDLPYDPQDTLEQVRESGEMHVGVVSGRAPWAFIEVGEAGGTEVEIARRFAEKIGPDIEIQWVPGSESELLEALERFELDLVIGGMTSASPWKKHVAFTKPYATTRWMVGTPPGAPPLKAATIDQLSGRQVFVERGSAAAASLKERGAEPVEVDDPASAEGLVAGQGWQLSAWGFQPIPGITLRRDQRVLAVPPGENGWLVRLEKFLHQYSLEIGQAVDAEAER